jgi:multiple sugar transport system permease protein
MDESVKTTQVGISVFRPTRSRIRPGAALAEGARLVVLLAFAAFFLVPLLWLLLAPTKTDHQLISSNPLAFGSLSEVGTTWSHLLLYNDREILTWATNSVIYVGATLIITVLISLPAGYALATAQFRGRSLILVLTLIAMITPASALVLPLFLEINAVHLINTYLSVILPSALFPFGVYLSFIYFATSLPRELLSAGRVDGCSETRLFWYVVLPLAKPMLGLVAFFSFVNNWNNFFLPFVMLTDDLKYNLPVGLEALIAGTPALHPTLGGSQLPIYRPEAALAGLIVVLPIVLVFLFSQRFVVAGMLSGAQKG